MRRMLVGNVKMVEYENVCKVIRMYVEMNGEEVVRVDGRVERWGRLKDVCKEVMRRLNICIDVKRVKDMMMLEVNERRYMRDGVMVVEDWVVV